MNIATAAGAAAIHPMGGFIIPSYMRKGFGVRQYRVPGPIKAGNHISKRGTIIPCIVWPGCEWRGERPAMLAARREKRRG